MNDVFLAPVRRVQELTELRDEARTALKGAEQALADFEATSTDRALQQTVQALASSINDIVQSEQAVGRALLDGQRLQDELTKSAGAGAQAALPRESLLSLYEIMAATVAASPSRWSQPEIAVSEQVLDRPLTADEASARIGALLDALEAKQSDLARGKESTTADLKRLQVQLARVQFESDQLVFARNSSMERYRALENEVAEQQIADRLATAGMRTVDGAVVSSLTEGPDTVSHVVVGAGLGMIAGLLLGLALDLVPKRVARGGRRS